MANEIELTDPIDPDIDLRTPAHRRELVRHHGPVLAAVALGGGLGALARYGLTLLLPTRPSQFPWAHSPSTRSVAC